MLWKCTCSWQCNSSVLRASTAVTIVINSLASQAPLTQTVGLARETKGGFTMWRKAARACVVNFREWWKYWFSVKIFYLTHERNAKERKDRIQVYPRVALRCDKRRRVDDASHVPSCVILWTRPKSSIHIWTSTELNNQPIKLFCQQSNEPPFILQWPVVQICST